MTSHLVKDTFCFGCGRDNPHGLQLTIEADGGTAVRTRVRALERYKGWSAYLHGGIITLVFDELLGWLSLHMGHDTMTARLEVRYRKPVPLGSVLVVRARLEREARGLLDIRLSAVLEDGTLVADGKGRMMIVGKTG